LTDEPFALSPRRKSRPVHVGDVQVGGDAPVVVQTMTNTDTADARATIEQIARLADEGSEIVRIAVPDKRAAAAVPEIVAKTVVPLIADIHFDHRLALEAINGGIHGLRLNTGNIRDARKGIAKADDLLEKVRVRRLRAQIAAAGLTVLREELHVTGTVRKMPPALGRWLRDSPLTQDALIGNMEYVLAGNEAGI